MRDAAAQTPDGKEICDDGVAAAEDTGLPLDIDVEMALLALSAQDVGEPTEDIDLSALSPTEKRVLLEILRRRLYGGDAPAAPSAELDSAETDDGRIVA